MRILTIGASGFIGSHVVTAGEAIGVDTTRATSIRVDPRYAAAPDPSDAWRRENPALFDRLCDQLAGYDVVVNAAGRPDPGGRDSAGLLAANAVQPAVVASAGHAAGVRRLIHVSTAAVQGRIDPLDETSRHQPLSPYAVSKARGEQYLLDPDQPAPPEVVVYRPTSVHGAGRRVTHLLARVARAPAIPIRGHGDQPLPLALIENVAAGIIFAATTPELVPSGSRSVVLHPSEGLTTRLLLELFGARRLVPVPSRVTEVVLRPIAGLGSRSPRVVARARWLELFWRGQSVEGKILVAAGFTEPVGHAGWAALGREALSVAHRTA